MKTEAQNRIVKTLETRTGFPDLEAIFLELTKKPGVAINAEITPGESPKVTETVFERAASESATTLKTTQ